MNTAFAKKRELRRLNVVKIVIFLTFISPSPTSFLLLYFLSSSWMDENKTILRLSFTTIDSASDAYANTENERDA